MKKGWSVKRSSECDHILGISEIRVTDRHTGETLALVKEEVTASLAKWEEGSDIIPYGWTGTYYKFCPNCGAPLGELAMGLRF